MANFLQLLDDIIFLDIRAERDKGGGAVVHDHMGILRHFHDGFQQAVKAAIVDLAVFHHGKRRDVEFGKCRQCGVHRVRVVGDDLFPEMP